jgi:hypothetical protein
MPPEPKPPSRRRRRNKVAGEGTLPAAGRQGPAPELPTGTGLFWLDWTRAYWATIWSSPMATRWTEYDVPALARLAKLQQEALFEGDGKHAAEIRQLEDRFGLNPRGRRLLGWEIVDVDEPADDAPAEASEDAPLTPTPDVADASTVDPRRLRLIQGA